MSLNQIESVSKQAPTVTQAPVNCLFLEIRQELFRCGVLSQGTP